MMSYVRSYADNDRQHISKAYHAQLLGQGYQWVPWHAPTFAARAWKNSNYPRISRSATP